MVCAVIGGLVLRTGSREFKSFMLHYFLSMSNHDFGQMNTALIIVKINIDTLSEICHI